MNDGALSSETRAWVQAVANRDYDGNWGAAAAGILQAAHEAEKTPDDPWAGLKARMQHRAQHHRQ